MTPRRPPDFYDLDIMSRTIWGESRSESAEGRRAVACVIINRWKSGKWFDGTDANKDGYESITEVCQQPWQFSSWNKNDPNLAKMLGLKLGDPVFGQCINIALKAIEDSFDTRYAGRDPSRAATHYYVHDSPRPKWHVDQKPCAIIGKHFFFTGIS